MEGHSRTAGLTSNEFNGGGKSFALKKLTVGDYAKLEEFTLSLRGNPLASAVEALRLLPDASSEERREVWATAREALLMPKVASKRETNEVANTLVGIGFFLWAATLANEPKPFSDSVERGPIEAKKFIEALTEAEQIELKTKIQIATGEIELGNSSGQTLPQ